MIIVLFYLILTLLVGKNILGQEISKGELLITEVLFNPARNGFDYVEAYNATERQLPLNKLKIAGRGVTGELKGAKALTTTGMMLQPGQYFVVTENEPWLRQQYDVPDSGLIFTIGTMPSMPDDEGTVLFLANDSVIDELSYNKNWHFQLIADPEGVALERISIYSATNDKNNWTSASSSSGFGTPGFQNSHFRGSGRMEEEVVVTPKVFSPDNDGVDDFSVIQFSTGETGWMANVTIFNLAGKKVCHLLRNVLLGTNSIFRWQGLDDMKRPAAPGMYIMVAELFNLRGQSKIFKRLLILQKVSN